MKPEDIQRFWAEMMASGVEPKDALKASELLARSLQMFTQKQEVEITVKDPKAEIDKLLSDMADRMAKASGDE